MLEAVRRNALILPNRDLDDGKETSASEYSLADEAYATLLAKLSKQSFEGTSPELRDNIITFYADLSLPIETRRSGPLAGRPDRYRPAEGHEEPHCGPSCLLIWP
jgi:hypothetical protein